MGRWTRAFVFSYAIAALGMLPSAVAIAQSQPKAKTQAPPLVFRQAAAKAAYDRSVGIVAYMILCRTAETDKSRFTNRAGAVVSRLEGVAANSKLSNGNTASGSLIVDGWVESWMVSMGQGRFPLPNCATFAADYGRMRISRPDWRVEEGLR